MEVFFTLILLAYDHLLLLFSLYRQTFVFLVATTRTKSVKRSQIIKCQIERDSKSNKLSYTHFPGTQKRGQLILN